MMRFLKYPLYSILLILFSLDVSAQFYNGYDMQFGKNRVQYDDRFWQFMRFKNFDTYYYLGGLDLAAYVARVADTDLEEIEKLFDTKLDGRLQFVIYNKLSEAKQSNITLETDELANNTGGVTKIVGNKILLYYEGDHELLHQHIREGIARVLIEQIMYGGDIRERIQNSALLSLPDWYLNGLISYASEPWDITIDNRVRDGIISKKYLKINHLSGRDAIYAGHSIWKYIADTYTEGAIANLLYMTHVNRNIESGMMYVLGLSMKELSLNWANAMQNRYGNADANRDSITSVNIVKRPKLNLIYTQLHTSPDGRYTTYISNDLGKYKLYLYENDKKKRKRILKGGYRSYAQETDVSFPVVAWHPTGQLLAIIRERKGKLWLGTYTTATKKFEEGLLFNFEKVIDFSYAPDGQSIVLSAVVKGQTDIFVYNLRTRTFEQITKDIYDDVNPHFINDGRAIVFASTREQDSLKNETILNKIPGPYYDIFYYDYFGKSSELRRITNTPYYNETQPMQYDSANITYLSDENGIVNRYVGHLDSALSFVDTTEHYRMIVDHYILTDYPRNIIQQDVNATQSRISEIIYRNGRYNLYVNRPSGRTLSMNSIQSTPFRSDTKVNEGKKNLAVKNQTVKQDMSKLTNIISDGLKEDTTQSTPAVDTNEVNIDNYVFQSDFPKSKNKKEKKDSEKNNVDVSGFVDQFIVKTDTVQAPVDSTFKLPTQRNYETAFSSNYFVTQLFDHSLLNQSYQLFTGGGAGFYNPGFDGFFKLGIRDLLDDYRITGGVKLTYDLNSIEYFLQYENLKKRFDKKIMFSRQTLELSTSFTKLTKHELRYAGAWPFSDVTSIRGSIAYRNDRYVAQSVDFTTLHFPNEFLNWGSARLEFVFDNTLSTGVNLFNGTRLKLFGEYYKQIDRENSGITIVGADIRHYQKIHRDLIWANRFAAGTSFGPEKLIYYMGSTDNWLSPRFNNETPIDYSQNYYFQTLATNMRGFDQNIRNGNSFALINSEIRFPVFKYFLNRPIKSDFVRNFQIIGFGDVGTAWNGSSPYDSTNALNRKVYSRSPFVITINSQNEPIVGGMGFGLRSRILGYFIRADWAWGIENRVILPYKFYFSFGLDF
jgi:Tol biopolymer transport system component